MKLPHVEASGIKRVSIAGAVRLQKLSSNVATVSIRENATCGILRVAEFVFKRTTMHQYQFMTKQKYRTAIINYIALL